MNLPINQESCITGQDGARDRLCLFCKRVTGHYTRVWFGQPHSRAALSVVVCERCGERLQAKEGA